MSISKGSRTNGKVNTREKIILVKGKGGFSQNKKNQKFKHKFDQCSKLH